MDTRLPPSFHVGQLPVSGAAEAAPVERSRVIVKYISREGRDVPSGHVEVGHANIDEARYFAMDLVRNGAAHPESITIYEKTGFQVVLSCDAVPQPPDPPPPAGRRWP